MGGGAKQAPPGKGRRLREAATEDPARRLPSPQCRPPLDKLWPGHEPRCCSRVWTGVRGRGGSVPCHGHCCWEAGPSGNSDLPITPSERSFSGGGNGEKAAPRAPAAFPVPPSTPQGWQMAGLSYTLKACQNVETFPRQSINRPCPKPPKCFPFLSPGALCQNPQLAPQEYRVNR